MRQAEIDARINALLKGKRGKITPAAKPQVEVAPVVVEEVHSDEVVVHREEETTPTPAEPLSAYEAERINRKLHEAREEAKALAGIMSSFNEFRKNNVGVPINEMLPTFGESMTQPTYGNNSFDHPEKSKPRRGNVLPNTFCNNV